MNSILLRLTLLAVTYLWLLTGAGCQTNMESPTRVDGFGYELLIGRIEHLENELRESRTETTRLVEMVLRKLEEFDRGVKNTYIENITSCRQAVSSKSGWYKLKLLSTSFDVYCEQQLYGAGWIVIQNRFDGSVDFYRNWNDYRNGFGNLEEEFWIGLEKIYQLTSSRIFELVVLLESFDGVVKYSRYAEFEIDSENEKYKLQTLVHTNGTAGDSLQAHKYAEFSTLDLDNDEDSTTNLADEFHAGWWFHGYSENVKANLNGVYTNTEKNSTMHWFGFNSTCQGLKISKMMIREYEPGTYARQRTTITTTTSTTKRRWWKAL